MTLSALRQFGVGFATNDFSAVAAMSDDPNLVSAQFGSRPASPAQARRVPFRVVIVGDFGLPPGRLHGFDDQTPDEALASSKPGLDLVVPDRLTGGDRPLGVNLRIESLRDFSPARLVETVPELAKAMAIRDRLRTGTPAAEAFAEMPGLGSGIDTAPATSYPTPAAAPQPPAPPPPASTGDDPLDRLFDMVDTPDGQATAPTAPEPQDDTAKRAVSAFIGSMGGRKPAAAAGAGDGAVAAVERRIASQIAAIVDDPAFRSLEAAWRGLRFLLRHCDRRAQCFVHAISADKPDAAEAARALLIDAADQQPAGLGLLVSAYDYGSGPSEIALLQALAEVGAETQIPVLASTATDFIHGVESADLARHRDPETLFHGEAYAPWASLRMKPVSRWLGVTINRFQLRGAHDLAAERRLSFAPAAGAQSVGIPLEACGAWLVAALASESAAATGWPSEMTGPDHVIDGLPLYGDPQSDSNVFAVAVALRPDAGANLGNAGLIALVGQANRDVARLVRVASVHVGRADPTGDLPREGTFDYQMLVSRLIRQIEGNADLIFSAGTPEGMRAAMQTFLTGLLGPGGEVRVTLEVDDEDDQVLNIHVATGRDTLGGVAIHLDLPV